MQTSKHIWRVRELIGSPVINWVPNFRLLCSFFQWLIVLELLVMLLHLGYGPLRCRSTLTLYDQAEEVSY